MVMGERISRLMDGEAEGAEADAALRELRQPEAVATWVCYHVIGDALRGSGGPRPGFADRFAARLAAEPTVLAPKPIHPPRLPFAWAAAATVAAVGVVGWVAVSLLDPQPSTVAMRAMQVKPAPVSADYLLAHRESSPTAQIQGVGPYLRPASAGGTDGRP
jgi:sigma-E factor negative regulatory protein RseA